MPIDLTLREKIALATSTFTLHEIDQLLLLTGGHEYPSRYGRGSSVYADEAWDIVDNFTFQHDTRLLLAGMIVGALIRSARRGLINNAEIRQEARADRHPIAGTVAQQDGDQNTRLPDDTL